MAERRAPALLAGHLGRGSWACAVVVALVLGCGPSQSPLPPPTPPVQPPGTEEDCKAACAHLEQLGCDDSWGGADCVEACWNIESSGAFTVCPRDIVKARTCEEADRASQCGVH